MTETRPFLQSRARVEMACADAAECIEAAVSHAGLARLYIDRCADMARSDQTCGDCDLGELCCCGAARHSGISASAT